MRTSPVWSFFTITNSTNQIAKCDMCKATISFKSSVSNLKRHLIKKHPTVQIGEAETHVGNTIGEDPDNTSSNRDLSVEVIEEVSYIFDKYF